MDWRHVSVRPVDCCSLRAKSIRAPGGLPHVAEALAIVQTPLRWRPAKPRRLAGGCAASAATLRPLRPREPQPSRGAGWIGDLCDSLPYEPPTQSTDPQCNYNAITCQHYLPVILGRVAKTNYARPFRQRKVFLLRGGTRAAVGQGPPRYRRRPQQLSAPGSRAFEISCLCALEGPRGPVAIPRPSMDPREIAPPC